MRGQIVPHSLKFDIPEGAAGTRETLKHMRQLVQQGKGDLSNRDLANRICAYVPAKDWLGELEAIFQFVRGRIRYALDPSDIETTQCAVTTLRLGYGDCDDFAVLLATLCESMGHPCCLVALGFQEPGSYEHVLTIASGAGELPWVAMDATETQPFGWFPKDAICEMIAPITGASEDALARSGVHAGLHSAGPGWTWGNSNLSR